MPAITSCTESPNLSRVDWLVLLLPADKRPCFIQSSLLRCHEPQIQLIIGSRKYVCQIDGIGIENDIPNGAGKEAVLLSARQTAPCKFSRVWSKENAHTHSSTASSHHLHSTSFQGRQAGRGSGRGRAIGKTRTGVDRHVGDGRGLTGGKLESSELPSRSTVARLELCLCGELEGEPSEGEREPATLLVVNSGSRRSKGLVDLLDCRRHVRTVEHQIAGEVTGDA